MFRQRPWNSSVSSDKTLAETDQSFQTSIQTKLIPAILKNWTDRSPTDDCGSLELAMEMLTAAIMVLTTALAPAALLQSRYI